MSRGELQAPEVLVRVTPVQCLTRGQQVASATAFFYAHGDGLYLVTNRHVVIDEDEGHFPDALRLRLHTDPQDLMKNAQYDVPLAGPDGQPVRLEHLTYGRDVEAGAEAGLEVLPRDEFYLIELNRVWDHWSAGSPRPRGREIAMGDDLGRLQSVDLRSVWTKEAEEFTPWMAREDNLRLLGDTIGVELELEAREKGVGPFWADLLCRDTASGDYVVIENQLTKTDHTHLGQVLTYAAGLHAVTVVWIAARFTDEHRAAIDWLNEVSGSQANFFALEIELWKIGDSQVAPKFNVVAAPNEYNKRNPPPGTLTETQQFQLQYWAAFNEYISEAGSTIRPTSPVPQTWISMGIGRTGFLLQAVVSKWNDETKSYGEGVVRAEVVVFHDDAKAYFDVLQQEKKEIEAEVGEPLTWYTREGVRNCRIYLQRTADVTNREDWPDQHEWLRQKLEALDRAFRPRIKAAQLPDAAAEGSETLQTDAP